MKRIVLYQILGLTLLAGAAHADYFPWYDDPNSIPVFGSITTVGNTYEIQVAVKNTGTQAHDIGVLLTQANTNVNSVPGNLAWDQAELGWSGSYGGNSLLVTASNPTGTLPFDEVANASGITQESYSYFNQPTDPAATYPYYDFGVIAPGATSPFLTFDLLFTWGGTGTGTVRLGTGWASIAPDPLPEPASLMLLATVALALGFIARWRIRQAVRWGRSSDSSPAKLITRIQQYLPEDELS